MEFNIYQALLYLVLAVLSLFACAVSALFGTQYIFKVMQRVYAEKRILTSIRREISKEEEELRQTKHRLEIQRKSLEAEIAENEARLVKAQGGLDAMKAAMKAENDAAKNESHAFGVLSQIHQELTAMRGQRKQLREEVALEFEDRLRSMTSEVQRLSAMKTSVTLHQSEIDNMVDQVMKGVRSLMAHMPVYDPSLARGEARSEVLITPSEPVPAVEAESPRVPAGRGHLPEPEPVRDLIPTEPIPNAMPGAPLQSGSISTASLPLDDEQRPASGAFIGGRETSRNPAPRTSIGQVDLPSASAQPSDVGTNHAVERDPTKEGAEVDDEVDINDVVNGDILSTTKVKNMVRPQLETRHGPR